MSNVTDTVARILLNVDGETKQESHGVEETLEVLDLVRAELDRRAELLRPGVEAARESREKMYAPAAGVEVPEDVPAVAQPMNTPATHVDVAPISGGGSEGANDL